MSRAFRRYISFFLNDIRHMPVLLGASSFVRAMLRQRSSCLSFSSPFGLNCRRNRGGIELLHLHSCGSQNIHPSRIAKHYICSHQDATALQSSITLIGPGQPWPKQQKSQCRFCQHSSWLRGLLPTCSVYSPLRLVDPKTI